MNTAIVTVVMFLVMISIHEFGHFIVSKMFHVNVQEFAIGMGPAIFKKQGKKTLYSVRILPIGGFCKFDNETIKSNDEHDLTNQPAWKRFFILIAGAVLNIVLGYIIFVIIVSRSQAYTTTVVDVLDPNSYIAESGIMAGDEIIAVNGHSIGFYPEFELYSRDFSAGESAKIKVKRNNEKLTFDVKLSDYKVTQTYQSDSVMVLTEVNGTKTEKLIPYSDTLAKDESLIGKSSTYSKAILGFTPLQKDTTVSSVITEAYHYTFYVVKLVYKSLIDMITGKVSIDQMSGPVGIVSEVNNAVNSGAYSIENTLNLIGLLTINLGIFNLLPLPALDGGRLIFVIYEMISRKPVPPEKEELVHVIGFVLLMLFALYITFFDIIKLTGK